MKIHYNMSKLKQILSNVYEFIKAPISVYDEKFKYIAATASLGEYCLLLRRLPENLQQCSCSDREGCARCKKSNTRISYKCYAGLWETIVPIKRNGLFLGYIMFGAYRLAGDNPDVREYARRLGVNEDELEAAYGKLSVLTHAQVVAASEILQACIIQLIDSDAIFFKENEFSELIKKHIDNNLSSNITIESLCKDFLISRKQLHTVFKSAFNITIKQYILEKRIELAKHLLLTGTQSVTEISELCGFSDYNNFIQRFKRLTDQTPLQYRKLNAK